MSGRIADIGSPTSDQIKITKIAELKLDHAAVKVREGKVGVSNAFDGSKWVGVLLTKSGYQQAEPDPSVSEMELPGYISDLIKNT